jgi:hypothetical protein
VESETMNQAFYLAHGPGQRLPLLPPFPGSPCRASRQLESCQLRFSRDCRR